MSSWTRRAHIFETMPRGSLAVFLLGVAALFAGMGTITDSLAIEQGQRPALLTSIVLAAGSAVVWAFVGAMQMRKALLAVAAAQLAVYLAQAKWFPRGAYKALPSQLMTELALRDSIAMGSIFAGYMLFILFFRREGKRFFAVHTEMELAAEIQKNLVPPIALKVGAFDIYGISVPSGRVGGDLVDVVTNGDQFVAYLADVAGHGVQAGVLMSMVKTAVRMRIASAGLTDGQLLPTLNATLQPLTSPSSYLTFAYVSGLGRGLLQFSLAAHLPMVHYQSKANRIVSVAIENLPVGMFPGVAYETGVLNCEPGDIVLMLTDGLTEIFDSNGREAGSSYVEEIIKRSPQAPLSELAAEIMRRSESLGPVTDDRSLLMVRGRSFGPFPG